MWNPPQPGIEPMSPAWALYHCATWEALKDRVLLTLLQVRPEPWLRRSVPDLLGSWGKYL